MRIYRHPLQEVVVDEDLLAMAGYEVGLDAHPLLRGVRESYARSRGRTTDRQFAQLGCYWTYPRRHRGVLGCVGVVSMCMCSAGLVTPKFTDMVCLCAPNLAALLQLHRGGEAARKTSVVASWAPTYPSMGKTHVTRCAPLCSGLHRPT